MVADRFRVNLAVISARSDMKRKLFIVAFIYLSAICVSVRSVKAFGGEGRVLGTVVDASGTGVAGAVIKVTRADVVTFLMDKTSDAKGSFSVLLLDASRKYRFHIEKDGYAPLDQDVQPAVGETIRVSFTLQQVKTSGGQPVASAPSSPAARPAVPGPSGSKYVSPDGRFSITIPGEPSIKNDPDGSVFYSWFLQGGEFVINSTPVDGLFTAESRHAALESMKAEAIRQDPNRMAFILDFRWYSLLTYTAHIPSGEIKVVFVPTPKRLYIIHFIGPPYEKTYWDRVESYYYSFAVRSDGESTYKLAFDTP